MVKANKPNAKYEENGIMVSPATLSRGDTAHIIYNGLLARSGADKVYVHVGFGEEWEDKTEYMMTKSEAGFEADVILSAGTMMNMCFKDSANNWDNNTGMNYPFKVTTPRKSVRQKVTALLDELVTDTEHLEESARGKEPPAPRLH